MTGDKERVVLNVTLLSIGLTFFLMYTLSEDSLHKTKHSVLAGLSNVSNRENAGMCRKNFSEPYDVIILTYMRSGSTYLGNLLGSREDSFYWYEPLWATHTWKYHSTGQTVCNYGKEGCENITSDSPMSIQSSLKFLLNIYRCNLTGYSDRFYQFLTGSRKLTGPSALPYINCVSSGKTCKECLLNAKADCKNCTATKKCGNCSIKSHKECFDKWIERCNSTTHRVTKVLRMDTVHIQYILERHARLKLIQVFRDPRAVMRSRKERKMYSRGFLNMTTDAKIMCNRIEKDLNSAKQLMVLFPGRVKIIQYEDLYDKYRTSKALYEFVNMKRTDIQTNTVSNNTKNRGIHTDLYRSQLEWQTIVYTNAYCENAYKLLGLRPFYNASQIKDQNLSVVEDKLPFTLT